MLDPASEGEWEWTQADIDGVMGELGRRMMAGKFNPRTWEGEDFTYVFQDGTERGIHPPYFGYVYKQWCELKNDGGAQ
jgi:hypothetical protein